MTIATFEVRHSRPDEYLRELALNVQDGSLQDGIVRLAVVRHRATRGPKARGRCKNCGREREFVTADVPVRIPTAASLPVQPASIFDARRGMGL